MYGWLTSALDDELAIVVSANRRLARTLRSAYGEQQVTQGRHAWKSPAVYSWRAWLDILIDSIQDADTLPVRINDAQSRVLWERCLRADIDDPLLNYGSLARQCRDTWQRMHEWCVSLEDCVSSARGPDQKLFARAASTYQRTLRDKRWIDSACLPDLLVDVLGGDRIRLPSSVTLAGFDRITPQLESLLNAISAKGTRVHRQQPASAGTSELRCFDDPAGELRAAGAWARTELDKDPGQALAIVVGKLEQDAAHSAALVREGMVPGWQYAASRVADAVNVSYGSRLATYPAIRIALLALRWLHGELHSAEVSLLLRSPFLGVTPLDGRSILELQLRQMPDRLWTPELLIRALSRDDNRPDAVDWLQRVGAIRGELHGPMPSMAPSAWAEVLDTTLRALNWPGDAPLHSDDFQLENRWRECLNEFSRLELVCPRMHEAEAISRLTAMASDALFQPESDGAVVSILGPLEAAGMQFDQLWMCGITAAEWPPSSRALPLLSKELQLERRMPDSTPDESARFARLVLERIESSAGHCIFSYPASIADAEQRPSTLIKSLPANWRASDPGWHAASLGGLVDVTQCADRVPAVGVGELIGGGAATIQRQENDPFSAFAFGRLGIGRWSAFTTGIAPNLRGNLIHDALYRLYAVHPSQRDIVAWSNGEIDTRIERAVSTSFHRYERCADALLAKLLRLEKRRTVQLLHEVIEVDRARDAFSVQHVETSIRARLGNIELQLRCDRIDQSDSGKLIVLDYKTGAKKKLLSKGEPNELQLIVYATVLAEEIAGLGLFNVDCRETAIDGAGPAFTESDDWSHQLSGWIQTVLRLATEIERGDVRLNQQQNSRDARPLALLSRYPEVLCEQS